MEIIDFLIHPEVLDVFADDPKSSTHHSSAAGKRGPCKSGARRKIVSVAAVPEINIRKGRCIVGLVELVQPYPGLQVVAESEIQSQVMPNFPLVLNIFAVSSALVDEWNGIKRGRKLCRIGSFQTCPVEVGIGGIEVYVVLESPCSEGRCNRLILPRHIQDVATNLESVLMVRDRQSFYNLLIMALKLGTGSESPRQAGELKDGATSGRKRLRRREARIQQAGLLGYSNLHIQLIHDSRRDNPSVPSSLWPSLNA